MRGGLARVLGEALQSQQSNDSELDTHHILLRILNQQFTEPLRQRGERMPNAGILLLTKEQGEDDEAQGYGARSPQKAWQSLTQAPPNPHLRHSFCVVQHRLAPP
jgi:hypothetical protein